MARAAARALGALTAGVALWTAGAARDPFQELDLEAGAEGLDIHSTLEGGAEELDDREPTGRPAHHPPASALPSATFGGEGGLSSAALLSNDTISPIHRRFLTVTLEGFPHQLNTANRYFLNGKYVQHPDYRLNRHPILIGGMNSAFFLYYCAKEDDWRIGIYLDWGPTLACECLAFAHSVKGVTPWDTHHIRFPGLQDGVKWHWMKGDEVPRVTEIGTQTEMPTMHNGTKFAPPEIDRTDCASSSPPAASEAVPAPTPTTAPGISTDTARTLGSAPAPGTQATQAQEQHDAAQSLMPPWHSQAGNSHPEPHWPFAPPVPAEPCNPCADSSGSAPVKIHLDLEISLPSSAGHARPGQHQAQVTVNGAMLKDAKPH